MPYFTSWDANLYLCLMSLGLHHDISLSLTMSIKKVHRDYCLEDTRSYYLDRKKWLPQIGTKSCKLKKGRHAEIAHHSWIPVSVVYDSRYQVDSVSQRSFHKEFNMRAICQMKSIPEQFWDNLGRMNFEYEEFVRKIEPHDRNDYFEWAYENYYHGWNSDVLEWVQGFHPGRWILMDMKRGESLEDIRELEDWAAYTEERFIRNKDHIDDLLAGKSLYNR